MNKIFASIPLVTALQELPERSIIRYQPNCSYKDTPFNDFMFHSFLDTIALGKLSASSKLEELFLIFLNLCQQT
jgi:hypothetical protein